ncbi:hypothetical protein BC835DRAFT_1346044 [Cytidiella melzeri]|nr:hypothetical protein BC835DRAFT_1346044 [Cytidiella melzeri]
MASREPLWYCHECHAEMRPLMVPDPHCASCNGTFVEKMENPADDPREFTAAGDDVEDPFSGGGGGGDNILLGLLRAMAPPQSMNRSASAPVAASMPSSTGGGSAYTIRVDRTSTPGGGARTTFSSRPMQSERSGEIPTLSDYVARNPPPGARPDGNAINGSLMFQYLLAMLQQSGRQGQMGDLFGSMMPPGAENGRMGDYVFNQEALDQIISQIMENSAAHPVAATEEIINNLPREVLEEGSPLLQRDCAVCKDQFQLGTEDPDEQIVVTLPCKHPFHEPCIIPWLKSSGTCPVCRHQLVPQPEHHAPAPTGSNGSRPPGNGNGNSSQPPAAPGGFAPGGPGFFGNLFHILNTGGSDGNTSNSTGNTRPSGTNERQRPQSTSQDSTEHIPGGWNGNEVD